MLGSARLLTVLRVVSTALIALVVIRTAWVSDDALITLRNALNITHGWGAGFNATEAVQAYSHPLWFLIWVGVGSWTNQWILGVIAMSAVFVAIAVALLLWRAGSIARVIAAAALLLLSNAFIDYSSSGLENPLAYASVGLLISLTLLPSHQIDGWGWKWSVLVGLTAAAVALTRFDLLVLMVIPLAFLAWHQRSEPRRILIALGSFIAPLMVWFAWSQFTYAALLPNTFAAKTNVGIPQSEFIIQGLRYLWVTFANDPVTLIGLALGIGVAIAIGPAMNRGWALGALAYVGYVVWIGGDFMAGRFLAVPFYVAVFVLVTSTSQPSHAAESTASNSTERNLLPALALVGVLFATVGFSGIVSTTLTNPQGPRWEVDQNFNAGVSDELGIYVANGRSFKSLVDTLSLAYTNPDIAPLGDGTGLNRTLREIDRATKNWPTNDGAFTLPSEVGVFCGFLGTIGIATGPTTHLIDSCALTDRFLAERSSVPTDPFAWKPGHFYRDIPEGYLEAIAAGDPTLVRDMADSFELAQLWEKIR